MRLRRRLAIALAGTTSLTVAITLVVTVTAFRHGQERQLDHELLLTARQLGDLVGRNGETELGAPRPASGNNGDLDDQVQYVALYRRSGKLLYASANLGAQPPPLGSLLQPNVVFPVQRLEFPVRGTVLRGVLVRVDKQPSPEQRLLLLAASRADLDTDTFRLLRLMLGVLGGAVALSLLIGSLLGRHLAVGFELLAEVARRVSTGELAARVTAVERLGDAELRSLAGDLNLMIDRLASLVTAGRRFVSHAAHELRSPLAALRGELELALRHPRSAESYRASIAEALDNTNRLVTLAQDLLALARLEVSAAPSAPAAVALRELVSEAARASRVSRDGGDPQAEVAVRGVEPEDIPELQLRGRGSDLTRMLRNLLDNAIAHSPPGGEVRVRCQVEPQRVTLTVSDQGPGVSEELRERIFEPFFRGDAERERSGAGLGLAIAREIARAHGGDVYCERPAAPAPRRGATFVATIARL
jgi:two-component system heavy metal sensor histidine kinase CusS